MPVSRLDDLLYDVGTHVLGHLPASEAHAGDARAALGIEGEREALGSGHVKDPFSVKVEDRTISVYDGFFVRPEQQKHANDACTTQLTLKRTTLCVHCTS